MLTPELLAKALRAAADVLSTAKTTATKAKAVEAEEADDAETEEDDEDFSPKKKSAKKKAAAAFEDDEEDDEDKDEEPAPKKKAAPAKADKAPKLSVDDVNDACLAYAKEHGRPAVLAILKKNFKTKSVGDLEPEQFAEAIELLEV